MIRQAYRAGSFYEANAAACRQAAQKILQSAQLPKDLPKGIVGGLVPHAGWVFSGRTAAVTLKAMAAANRLSRVVIFGADHWGIARGGAVYDQGSWQTPLGELPVDAELAAALLKACPQLHSDERAHAREHSIEVQLPLMQVLQKGIKIVPINVMPSPEAAPIGRAVGEVLARDFPEAGVVGSTDLTHYGPQYGFTPGGMGDAGLEWARENDRRVLKLVEMMRAEQIVEESDARRNACGGGAMAAAVAAAAAMGAKQGLLLEYTSSAEVLRQMERLSDGQISDAVGYAAVVFA